ncbi:hypothetical protein [Andreprevotia chitinilytica]|uniref:hypothetical protein n=1 Tax=Andreprevotia chitinilytica TaxID=396808 RepID=UPI0012EC23B4|nr:hypothetical protein [Andreprevotia chitinilytica]
MKKIVASLLMGLGLTFAVAAPASADGGLWCEIKHHVCDQGSTNNVCVLANEYCVNG